MHFHLAEPSFARARFCKLFRFFFGIKFFSELRIFLGNHPTFTRCIGHYMIDCSFFFLTCHKVFMNKAARDVPTSVMNATAHHARPGWRPKAPAAVARKWQSRSD